ncbi:hypothetical protein [Helicobacter pylori]|uniref:hypothetical protein n=1 Tax=Helicobacter pylori TaxID=210 RepID=UPI003570B377
MWNEKVIKVIPAILFLFCILSIFQLFLIIEDMNKTEKLEVEIRADLNMLEQAVNHLKGTQLEHFKKIKIK